MFWLIFTLPLIVLALLVFSPIILEIDTRVPFVKISCVGLGYAVIRHESEELWLKFTILFYSRELDLLKLKRKTKKKSKKQRRERKKMNVRKMVRKGLDV